MNNHTELAYWLVINRCPKIGPRRFALLLQQENSLSNCFNQKQPRAEFLQWCQHIGITHFEPDWEGVEQDLNWATQQNCHLLTWQDATYPAQLQEIAAPPPVLYLQGNSAILNTPQLALVGSRQPSVQGRENAYQFAGELVSHSFTVTSGLALGIDTASHEGALAAKGHTIAVLGNGLDKIYPAKNIPLAAKISEKGLLVSEFPLGTPPKPAHFPQRNRIISGLSLGVVVVESALKSGSLITANYALEQGREIFALPGSIHNPMAKGCHQLIRQGAKCVESVEHILEELPRRAEFTPLKRVASPNALLPSSDLIQPPSEAQNHILAHFDEICTPVDSIIDRSGLTPEQVSSMLLELELAGWVAAVPGGYVRVRMTSYLG